MKMYEMGPEKREEIGARAAARARREYDINNVVKAWDESLEKVINNWKDPNFNKNTWRVKEL